VGNVEGQLVALQPGNIGNTNGEAAPWHGMGTDPDDIAQAALIRS